ncbi:MAG: hypothetical protein ABJA50_12050 [Chloroflexota bacterium]
MNSKTLLAKLEDFRLLPVFVLFSMAVGIAIGKLLNISDFALTPPIDAIKSIFSGTFDFSVPNAISLGVPIGLFLMMYPPMTNVRLNDVGVAFRSPKQLAVVAFFNYLIAPFFMLLLANIFVSDPELHTGLVLYGLAPCIAMVIIFTYLAKGNTPWRWCFKERAERAAGLQSNATAADGWGAALLLIALLGLVTYLFVSRWPQKLVILPLGSAIWVMALFFGYPSPVVAAL